MKPAATNHFPKSPSTATAPGAISRLNVSAGSVAGNSPGFNPTTGAFVFGDEVASLGGIHYSWSDGGYEDGNGNFVGWNYINANFDQPNAAFTVNFTDPTAFGTDKNPYQYFSIRVNGKRWNSADGSAALQKLIDDALQGSGGQAGGGVPGWIGWTNNLATTVAYGAVKAGGSIGFLRSGAVRWYSNAWKGNQYVEAYDLVKLGSRIGQGMSFVSAGLGTVNFILSDKSWGDYGKLGISYLSAGLTYFPEPITTGIGISIGFIDAAGGFNSFYNFLDINQQLYNSTGSIILPVNGFPQYVPLKW